MSESKELLNLTPEQLFSHDHPMEFTEEHKKGSDEVYCSRCGDPIEGSCYSCSDCKFYLHETCSDLPLNINHPLHEHALNLQVKSPYPTQPACDLCSEQEGFFYHCSPCQFDLDVKCALTPEFISGDFTKLQHFSHPHPLILVPRHNNRHGRFICAVCNEPTSSPVYCCMDCRGIHLHKSCAELPPEITHPYHRKHPLVLMENPPVHKAGCSCYLCKNPYYGFIYHCSRCEFGIKIKHFLPDQPENEIHEHTFILVPKPISFFCDACGTDGDCISYICTTRNLVVHKECISLPQLIKIPRHMHPISHIYYLPENEDKQWDCKICYNEVKTEYGSYYCSDCKYIVHVNCVRGKGWLKMEVKDVSSQQTMGLTPNDHSMNSAEDVTSTEIKHFDHKHNLMLSEEEMIDEKYCDACMVTISGPFYSCEQCSFILHKSCAKLPMETHFWFSLSEYLLQEYSIFACHFCGFLISGFHYISERKTRRSCLRCCAIPDFFAHRGHEHPVFYDSDYIGNCTGCGNDMYDGFRCKNSDFAVDYQCIALPETIRHKGDKHPLKLTYHDGDDPSQHYCDICEEERDPAYWFYSCTDCSFTAHPNCTLGNHPFINQGITATFEFHPHPLVTVRKVYYYPTCEECHKPCLDLALECTEPSCNYIIHWDCKWD
ncbi:Zinc finger, PHD-type [Corchorus olitorius]|uniref:Zinc finger, PHD-type n=1 Tax=Corchorus olitorius TaxID=93759 RepID=A0A1R3HF18_9ROSI|nr:Zinc finger, PHD-type [Corchorus olitorius]